jgi:hypothetical protein
MVFHNGKKLQYSLKQGKRFSSACYAYLDPTCSKQPFHPLADLTFILISRSLRPTQYCEGHICKSPPSEGTL